MLALADGRVVTARGGLRDNIPGHNDAFHPAVPITLETVAGNTITIDLGDGQFAYYIRKPNRAIIGRVVCHLSYLGVMEPGVRIDLTISCSQNERIASSAYPAKPGAGAGSRTPVSSLPKMCPV